MFLGAEPRVKSRLDCSEIVEIECFALQATILDACQKRSFDTHLGWLSVTQSARSRRSYGKIGDCEQSTARFEGHEIYCFPVFQ